jgi:peptidoglycan hydrolase CwlO-like protein
MKFSIFKLVFLVVAVIPVFYLFPPASAFAVSESDCLNKSAKDLSPDERNECYDVILPRIAAAYAPAQQKNKEELANLKKQIDNLNQKITSILSQLKNLEKEIGVREEDLAYTNEIFDVKVLNDYKRRRLYDPITPFLTSNAVDAFREVSYQQMAAEDDRKVMEKYGNDLATLKSDKENLEKNKVSLASLQKKVTEDAKFLEGEVGKVDSFLAVLSSKQQEILNAKNSSFIASVGDSDLADDYNASIKGFRESAPSGSFAVFSFGGYTHRKGMSQYGARGRAQNGQDYKQILKAYYGKEPVKKDTGGTISVSGYGALDFETKYLWGIAEMPSSWNAEALKAQAVAARTYAYRYKIEGKTICTDEGCQVFRKSKSDSPPDSWKQAVEATRGEVLEDVVTYYSSTTGGYLSTSGWDTTDGGGGSNFLDKTYEKLGGSPWVYKAWFRKGYASSGATCEKSNPWLNNEEFTDIVNAAVVLKNGSDSRITPTTTSCWGGNPYSFAELRAKGGVSSVSSVTVSQGNGTTNTVTVNGINFTGDEFKQAFNLRAPGYLSIPQKGFAFFNIEKK